jgi:hypothetical protein
MNDWSARDLQREEMKLGLGPSKGKDFATSLGPCLVTMDELQNLRKNAVYDLGMFAYVNDLNLSLDSNSAQTGEHFDGSRARYQNIRALSLPSSVERFLLGSEVSFCAREGRMPEPPLQWLVTEPSFIDIVIAKAQTTLDRQQPLWRL